jgi:hypothetical protein
MYAGMVGKQGVAPLLEADAGTAVLCMSDFTYIIV